MNISNPSPVPLDGGPAPAGLDHARVQALLAPLTAIGAHELSAQLSAEVEVFFGLVAELHHELPPPRRLDAGHALDGGQLDRLLDQAASELRLAWVFAEGDEHDTLGRHADEAVALRRLLAAMLSRPPQPTAADLVLIGVDADDHGHLVLLRGDDDDPPVPGFEADLPTDGGAP